jgi:hypothetical protein
MFIQTEQTPNPLTLKFVPGRDVMGEGSREFRDPADAQASPLARAIFAVDGVRRVFLGPDFVTVTKTAEEVPDWRHLKAPILAEIMDHFTSGRPLFEADEDETAAAHGADVYEGDAAQIVAEIKELLDTRIRPAVAQDGGDILFDRFEPTSGVVWLHMRAEGRCREHAEALCAGGHAGRADSLNGFP